jgi:hypothetical protein
MKKAFLLIIVPAMLVALASAQTPAASINTDQTDIKGCLGGSDGNYTVVEDNTGHTFKVSTSSVDLKPHLSHDVTLIGHRATGVSSVAADDSFAVTELKMISEHCAAAAAAPSATISTPAETAATPPAAAAPPAETAVTPPTAATQPSATAVTPPAAATPPAETAVTPSTAATPPTVTAIEPAATAAPTATVSTPSETARTPAARPRRRSEAPAAATAAPAVAASSSSEPVSTPAAAATPSAVSASTSLEPVSTPAAVATTPTAASKGWSLWLLIGFGVLVLVIGTMFPFFSRWRKQKRLERTGAPNLSFTRELSSDRGRSDQDKSDQPAPRKVA